MKKIVQKQFEEVLERHKLWLEHQEGGKRADLNYVDLSYVNLRYVNLDSACLRHINLKGADLTEANLSGADLIGADLSDADLSFIDLDCANLSYANLEGADLYHADLSEADLRDANLSNSDLSFTDLTGADLRNANLDNVKYNARTTFFALQCPEKGSFIGFKRVNKYIVELEIPGDAKRSSATSRECRCSKAKVLSITNLDGSICNLQEIASGYDKDFIYKIGKTIEVKDFDEDRWNGCSSGIHFFVTRDEAVQY